MQSVLKLTQENPLIMALGTLIVAMLVVSLIASIVRFLEKKLK